ncbi:hypothetical protein [Brachybacterium sp. NPDC056505]
MTPDPATRRAAADARRHAEDAHRASRTALVMAALSMLSALVCICLTLGT